MKTILELRRSTLLRGTLYALALNVSLASAQTWQTVDVYRYVGQGADASALAASPSGEIFAAGSGFGTDGLVHALITASADHGTTWSGALDDFVNGGEYDAYYNAIASDPLGNVYAAGYFYNNTAFTPQVWFVRRSADGGSTWTTVDEFQDGTINAPQANAVGADHAGNVYVVGFSAVYGWVVRKGIGGLKFTTVDSIPGAGGWAYRGSANAVVVHPTAGVFVAGNGVIATTTSKNGTVSNTYGWVVRRSTNGGASWSSVDKFTLSNGSSQATPAGIGVDALGNVYVVGSADSVSGSSKQQTVYTHWIVRKSADGGNTWTTVDNALSETRPSGSAPTAGAAGFGADASGNLYVAGYYNASNGTHWAVRENPGGNASWQTVDDFQYVAGQFSGPTAVATDAFGNVFVGGQANDATGTYQWVVRKR